MSDSFFWPRLSRLESSSLECGAVASSVEFSRTRRHKRYRERTDWLSLHDKKKNEEERGIAGFQSQLFPVHKQGSLRVPSRVNINQSPVACTIPRNFSSLLAAEPSAIPEQCSWLPAFSAVMQGPPGLAKRVSKMLCVKTSEEVDSSHPGRRARTGTGTGTGTGTATATGTATGTELEQASKHLIKS
ncbi:hypothetical protein DSL72_002370 [Monilinia vaccinii-corymbosi]|uniref:Uncharacterized protein n=1 Tax=Monilinia vaccinii-corymbosi TaxID=61207 RepID=A0A8A3PCI3_9HELO|nr:hypothetical protein DSL72_002370 [Monilinia vaccinii-corymbosi]